LPAGREGFVVAFRGFADGSFVVADVFVVVVVAQAPAAAALERRAGGELHVALLECDEAGPGQTRSPAARLPNRSAIGGRSSMLRNRIACTWFFNRTRKRTSCAAAITPRATLVILMVLLALVPTWLLLSPIGRVRDVAQLAPPAFPPVHEAVG
jgi:hypothetical protein